MSYKSGCCCSSGGRAGLGQTSQEVDAARVVLVNMISRESSRLEALFRGTVGTSLRRDSPAVGSIRQKIADASRWSRASFLDWEAGRNREALERATVGIRLMHEVSRAITALTAGDIQAAAAQARTKTGASFGDQMLATLGLKTGVYQPDVPGSSIADAFGGAAQSVGGLAASPWLLVAGAVGLLLFAAMRR